ncbi:transposase [Actinomadura darangshiensis]|uniref:transposase n=1 Tax=Actinomadura darangshiensis TaxID=705336 RepID=UPI001FB650D5|nr:transposase [Actinomadura darangshiensis]
MVESRAAYRAGEEIEPSSVRVYRDSLGHWYASFVVPSQVEPLPATGRAVGADWGVKELATTSNDAHDLPHPQHGRKAAAQLARYQRQMARRRTPKGSPGSKGYRDARRRAAKAHGQVARRRQDDARKWAKKLVRRDVRLVHPAHTTMDCGHCGARAKHALPLSERTYTCTACGAVSPRDKNSARVMLLRAGLNPDGADGVRPSVPAGSEGGLSRESPHVSWREGSQRSLPSERGEVKYSELTAGDRRARTGTMEEHDAWSTTWLGR